MLEVEVPAVRDRRALEAMRQRLAIWSLRMTSRAGSGHPSSCLSASHLVTALYFGGWLSVDPDRPDDPDRDRFILSKGHAVPIVYAALAERGFFDTESLMTLRDIGSPLEGHPNMLRVPGIESSTGSLGQGLSIGLGHALSARLTGRAYQVVVLTGDGELDEGQIWEAAMAAAKYRVANLIAVVDRNGYQQTGAADEVMPLDPLLDKWRAFGWQARGIDGHDWEQVAEALDWAFHVDDTPAVVIARTVKGYGISQIEADPGNKFHGVPVSPTDLAAAIAEVEAGEEEDE